MKTINSTLNSLVNSDLGSKVSQQIRPNIKDTKDIKEPLKDTTSSLINEAISEDETLELGLKKIVNKLLDAIKANKDLGSLGASAKEVVISKNLASDLKELKTILSKDDDLKPFATKLENLLNTKLQDSKALFQALNNTGVFLESKLRANLNEQVLPQSFFRLISHIKNIKTPTLKHEIFKLGKEQMSAEESLKKLENYINQKPSEKIKNPNIKTLEFLNNARAYLQKNENPIKIFNIVSKIEEKLDKEIKNLLSSEIKNDKAKSIIPRLASLKANIENVKVIIKDLISNQAQNQKGVNIENNIIQKLNDLKEVLSNNAPKMNESIKEIIKNPELDIKVKEEKIKPDNTETKDIKKPEASKEDLKPTEPAKSNNIKLDDIKSIKEEVKILNELKAKDISQELKILNNPEIKATLAQNQALNNILNNENLSLQNKIQNLTRLLSANLKNEEGFKNYIASNEIKTLKSYLNVAKKDAANIVERTSEHINKTLGNDAKGILLQTSQAALLKDNKAAYDLSQKMLNQIELNQLISVANSEVSTYLPYSIDDLDESSLSFKSDSEDKFYAQIKLKFKKLGGINILLGLNKEKYLDINMMIENDEFRQLLIKNAKDFKKDLRKAGLISSNFFISKLVEYNYTQNYELNLGFDKKV